MPSPIQLIVGLGNPGKEYADTRHNAGVWFVVNIAEDLHATLLFETKYHGLHCFTKIHEIPCHLLIPTTFMNHSGQAVRALMDYYKISSEQLLIVHDEVDLPVGTIKLKYDGGDGGHNGLKDIIRHLNTKKFYRLRVGIGRPKEGHAVHDYVLTKPSKADREKMNTSLQEAYDVLPLIMQGEMQKAMQKLHTGTTLL